jgi:hypothetical protein
MAMEVSLRIYIYLKKQRACFPVAEVEPADSIKALNLRVMEVSR